MLAIVRPSTPTPPGERPDASPLARALLSREQAGALDAHGSRDAGVLLAIFDHPRRPGLVLTERRADLRRHPGEISLPGGRPDPDEDLLACALREAHEEIDLDPAAVEVLGALPPVSTFVTGYRISPFVGLIPTGLRFTPNPTEVETVLELRLDELRAGFSMRRLVRRGVPFRTPTYQVRDDLVWGATARIIQHLLDRLDAD